MNANKIKKIKVLKNKYILFINGNEYPLILGYKFHIQKLHFLVNNEVTQIKGWPHIHIFYLYVPQAKYSLAE